MDTLKLSCITWNVETTWPDQDLHDLLGFKSAQDNKSESLSDIFIICLQEVRSQPQNVIMDTLFEEPWTTAFREVLGPFGYVRVTGERLQGIVTSIFVRRYHLPHLREIFTSVTRTGLGGLWGNKGAASVRFSIYGCSLCIVNTHLAAHDGGYEERCSNYNAIIDETSFPVNPTCRILYHDYVFWMGDLNYRLSGDNSPEALSREVMNGNLDSLLQKDELKKAQKNEDAFGPLTEEDIRFPPTYKYLRNSTDYDLSRRPAWTDRILHQVHVDAYENAKLGVQQLLYDSKSAYGQSDHKPVVAKYAIKVFANRLEKCATFRPIKEWLIGGVNVVKYTLDDDVVTSPWDYVAMFKSNFTSVHQYVTYSYVPQTLQPALPTPTPSPSKAAVKPSGKTFQLSFTDDLIQEPGSYVLLYYSGKYNSYLGMSDPFPVIRRTEQTLNILD